MEEYSGVGEEEKLELRLGPPDGDWSKRESSKSRGVDESLLSLSYLSNTNKRALLEGVNGGHHEYSSFLQLSSQELSQPGFTKGAVGELQTCSEKKKATAAANTAVHNNTSQKRTASGQVVGWPPLRSFRKNLASSSNNQKQIPELQQNVVSKKISSEKSPIESSQQKVMFVKINMDGVPIGRKVDLKAFDNYDKLSSAVDELFRGLLAAQNEEKAKVKEITGLLDGSGEYTLVYEDNEGDRMLVGDVPWHMFLSTVKRLRVLKSSDLSGLRCGKQVKL